MKKLLSTMLCVILVVMAILGMCSLFGKNAGDLFPDGDTSASDSAASSGDSSSGNNSSDGKWSGDVVIGGDSSGDDSSSSGDDSSDDEIGLMTDTFVHVDSTGEKITFIVAIENNKVFTGGGSDMTYAAGFFINDEVYYVDTFYTAYKLDGETKAVEELFDVKVEKQFDWVMVIVELDCVQGKKYTYQPFVGYILASGTLYCSIMGKQGTYVYTNSIL